VAKTTARTRAAAQAQAKRERTTLITGIVVTALLFVVLLFIFINQLNTNNSTPAAASSGKYAQIQQSTTADGSPMLGNPNAKVSIMEFSDFSCPHCAEYHPVVQQVIDQYVRTGKANFIYQAETFVGGPYSEVAAQAALCAGKQGRFWEMHDALFDMQTTRGIQGFNIEQMKVTADQLGINGTDVRACIARNEMAPVLQRAYDMGQKLGVNGTPAVVYSLDGGKTYTWLPGPDGQPMNRGGVPYAVIAQVIDKANQ